MVRETEGGMKRWMKRREINKKEDIFLTEKERKKETWGAGKAKSRVKGARSSDSTLQNINTHHHSGSMTQRSPADSQ